MKDPVAMVVACSVGFEFLIKVKWSDNLRCSDGCRIHWMLMVFGGGRTQ